MKPFRKSGNATYYIDVRWSGYPRVQVSARTTNAARARAMIGTLERLKTLGRRDVFGLVANGDLRLDHVHDTCIADINALDELIHDLSDYVLGPLVDEWLAWLTFPSTLAPKTHKPYAPSTVDRYSQSWKKFFAFLPTGRESRLSDITTGFVTDYRQQRRTASASAATVNRDIATLQSLFRWLADERGIEPPRVKLRKEREPSGRSPWLDHGEIATVRTHCPPEWWTLFALLMNTGLRVGEAQALTWSDVRFDRKLIRVHGKLHRLKTETSNRDVPMSKDLVMILSAHAATVPNRAVDPLFPDNRANRQAALKKWLQVLKKAGIPHATVHDLRHTFGVHALQSGIPLPRLQRLMGHATPTMTLRYTKHMVDDYFEGDAERLSRSLNGTASPPLLELVRDDRQTA